MSPRSERCLFVTLLIVTVSAFFYTTLHSAIERAAGTDRQHQLALIRSMRLALNTTVESQMRAILSRDPRQFSELKVKADHAIDDYRKCADQLASISDNARRALVGSADVAASFEAGHRKLINFAERSTNRQAMNLALGPCVNELDAIESKINQLRSDDQDESAVKSNAAFAAVQLQLALHKYQTLLIPHILEPSNDVMDQLEDRLVGIDQQVDESYKSLAVSFTSGQPKIIADIATKIETLKQLHRTILKLSRENTNVEAEELAMHGQLVATQKLEAMLDALESTLTRTFQSRSD